MLCIETVGLTHRYSSSENTLNGIGLQVPEGGIYGFLGPNGAGKTTTLKLILGLLKKQQGDIRVFGKPIDKDRLATLRNIGSLIESPSIYGHLTATENLRVLQKVYQCPSGRIQEVLDLVDLARTGSKKAAQFSLGMKQRLSIAIALLHDPSLLILDEPTNGLDPNGILEIRELLQKLTQNRGITILISSHLLPEIEKLVTHIGIINRGCLLFQGTLADLIKMQDRASVIDFRTSDNDRAYQIISDSGVRPTRGEEGSVSVPIIDEAAVARLNRTLIQNNIDVYRISAFRKDLEMIFFDVIGEKTI
ncbi:MAG: ABC transporter ATP-binding protein [Acidobacteria bacterium]|nr:ABC transporter ATP-binding protein [Acidobacteriota bacterium]